MAENFEREKELFNEALDLTSAEARRGFLKDACGPDDALREKIEALLNAFESADGFIPTHAGGVPEPDVPGVVLERPGDRIGRYKLLEKIGEGGCGIVFMAEQEEPVRRQVALKIIRLGLETTSVIARFEAERQALAMMDHPNIAKVFDGGVVGDAVEPPIPENPVPIPVESKIRNPKSKIVEGRPYFVMELVRGIRITDYCEQKNLSTRQRLDLFIQVCSAVQHAHQKGIIHRDLKPSNVLVAEVDGKPVPKVIDFGIAKATEQKLTAETIHTQVHQFLGTPAYMSPEQAAMSGIDIDTRSDIYSLGVLLYEMLTGTTPFDTQDLLQSGFDEMRRVIRETEPVKPSTRMTRMRTATPSKIQNPKSEIDRDLDWIVMKCLEKDRGRRYQTANGLAADVQRHLNTEPVAARPPSAAYRCRKMVRRNRVAFSAMAAVAIALVIGLGVAAWQSVERARAYRRVVASDERARAEAAKSQQVAKFLKDMIVGLKPSVAMGRDTSLLREIADQALEQTSTRQNIPPEVEVELRATLGGVYHVLGEYEKAEALHRETLPQMRRLAGADRPEVTELLRDYACVLKHRGKHSESEALARESLGIELRRHGEEHLSVAQSLAHLAAALDGLRRPVEAERLYRQSIVLYHKLLGPEHRDIAHAFNGLAYCLDHQSRHNEAESMYREALAMMKKVHVAPHPDVALVLEEFAISQSKQNHPRQAEALYRELLPLQKQFLGAEHRKVARTLHTLATMLVNRGQHAQAEPFAREALAIWKRARGDEHADVARAMHDLGMSLAGQARLAEAELLVREALSIQRRLLSPNDHYVLNSIRNLGRILAGQGKLSEAEPLFREALALARRRFAQDPDSLEHFIYLLAQALHRHGNFAESEALYRELLQSLQTHFATDHEEVVGSSADLGRLLADWAWTERVFSSKSRERKSEIVDRAREAEQLLRTCFVIRTNTPKTSARRLGDTQSRLGGAIMALAVTDLNLSEAERMSKLGEAETLLLAGYELMQQSKSAEREHQRDALGRLVRLYETWNKTGRDAEWSRRLDAFNKTNNLPEPVR